MKKIYNLTVIAILISILLSTNSYAKQKDEDRYPIPIRDNYTSVVGNMDKLSNIFNNQVKQKMFKKSMKHFQTVTINEGHYIFLPTADGYHVSRGLQWMVEADLNKNIIMLGLLVTKSTTQLQYPGRVKVVQIDTQWGTEKFDFPIISDSPYSMMSSDVLGMLFPNTNALSARMAKILTFMLNSKPNETIWFAYCTRDDVIDAYSEIDIRGMKDAVELFELLISV